MEISLKLLDSNRASTILNFSESYINLNPAEICLGFSIPESSRIPMDVIVKYWGDSGGTTENYAVEYYNIFNYSLSNTTSNQSIILYDLNSDDSTEFKIILTGGNFIPIEGALILIDRQYVAENGTFKTVEIPITDTNGQTVGHFVKNDVVYNIRAILNGTIITSLTNVIPFCEDLQLGNCQIELDPKRGVQEIFEYFNQGITFSAPTFDPGTNLVSFDFFSPDGSSHDVGMFVSKNDIFGNRTICINSVTSASGTLTCAVPGSFDESQLNVNITTNGELTAVRSINVSNFSYGDTGYVVWFILSLFLVLMFSESKTGILISMSVSYVGAVTLGLAKASIIGLGSAGIWVLLITIIGIWKLNKDRPQ